MKRKVVSIWIVCLVVMGGCIAITNTVPMNAKGDVVRYYLHDAPSPDDPSYHLIDTSAPTGTYSTYPMSGTYIWSGISPKLQDGGTLDSGNHYFHFYLESSDAGVDKGDIKACYDSYDPVNHNFGPGGFTEKIADLDHTGWYDITKFMSSSFSISNGYTLYFCLQFFIDSGTSATLYYDGTGNGFAYIDIPLTINSPANNPPTAYIDSISPDPATEGQLVTFTGHGTDTDGTVVGYQWRSNIDGILSTSEDFSTSTLSVGAHTIYYKVKDDDDAWSTEDSQTLTINPAANNPPTAYIDSISPDPATEGQLVIFEGHGTDTDGTVVGYQWRSNIDGILSTSEDFSTSTLSAAVHTIYYKVKDDDNAWSTEDSQTLTINPAANNPPTAYIDSISPDPATAGQLVIFEGHGTDTDGTVVAYQWRSNIDGILSTSEDFSTSTLSVAVHTIYYKVKDDDNAWSTEDSQILTVTSPANNPPNTPPPPEGPDSGKVGLGYTYCANTTDPDGDDIKYLFDWGDGLMSWTLFYVPSGTSDCAYHTWSMIGSYLVKVRAYDGQDFSQWSSTIIVFMSTANNPPGTPTAPSGPATGYIYKSYSYSTWATDPDGDDVSYEFDWGDGTTSWAILDSASHAWDDPGTYVVKARAYDGLVYSDWSSGLSVEIKTYGLYQFDLVVSIDKDAGSTFYLPFESGLEKAVNYLWDASDGQFWIRKITIYDNSHNWDTADIWVYYEEYWPKATIGGIDMAAGRIYLGIGWDGYLTADPATWNTPNGYRTIIHELGHYAFWLYDEYLYSDGTSIKDNEGVDALMHTVMAWQYDYSEFSVASDYSSPPAGIQTDTMHWDVYKKSAWEVIRDHYSLISVPTTPEVGPLDDVGQYTIIEIINSAPGTLPDGDADGIPDISDAFPNNPNENIDTDDDGIGDNQDDDDDNDGYIDSFEIAVGSNPKDPNEVPYDSDDDGIPNVLDTDNDNDGYSDVEELAIGTDPLDPSSFPKPDLTLSEIDIIFSITNPAVGDDVIITATIHNDGLANASNIEVKCYDGTIQIGTTQLISNIAKNGGKGEVKFDWTPAKKATHTIKMIVDPDNLIVEENENNNEASTNINVDEDITIFLLVLVWAIVTTAIIIISLIRKKLKKSSP